MLQKYFSDLYLHLWVYLNMQQVLPIVAGAVVAVTALAGKYGIQAWQTYKARPPVHRTRRFYEGGFQQQMTKREAALILGVRYFHVSIIFVLRYNSFSNTKVHIFFVGLIDSLCVMPLYVFLRSPLLIWWLSKDLAKN